MKPSEIIATLKGRKFSGGDKFGLIKRALIVNAITALIVSGAVFGISVLCDMWIDDYTQEKARLNGKVAGSESDVHTLQGKLDKATQSLPAFAMITKQYKGGLIGLDRQTSKDILDQLRDKYHLSSLRLAISPVEEMQDNGGFKSIFFKAISSTATVDIEALSDEHVMQFMTDLSQQFPGFVKITKLSMNRLGLLDDKALMEITRSGKMPLVKGQIVFQWMGTKLAEKPVTRTPPAPATKLKPKGAP